MNIVSRSGWDARKPKSTPTKAAPDRREYFVVHHSGAPATQSVRVIQDWCMDGRGFADIDYNHLVRATTGEIYEGRGWDVVGSHTANYNTSAVGVCIIGNDEISDAAKRSVRWLYKQYAKRAGHDLKVRGHRDLATTGTSCPGNRIAAWLAAGMPAPAAEPTTEDDMDLTPKNIDAIAAATVKKMMSITVALQKDSAGKPTQELLWTTALGYTARQAYLNSIALGLMSATDPEVDEQTIIAGVLAGLAPAAIAAAIPTDVARRVVDELTTRLQSTPTA